MPWETEPPPETTLGGGRCTKPVRTVNKLDATTTVQVRRHLYGSNFDVLSHFWEKDEPDLTLEKSSLITNLDADSQK